MPTTEGCGYTHDALRVVVTLASLHQFLSCFTEFRFLASSLFGHLRGLVVSPSEMRTSVFLGSPRLVTSSALLRSSVLRVKKKKQRRDRFRNLVFTTHFGEIRIIAYLPSSFTAGTNRLPLTSCSYCLPRPRSASHCKVSVLRFGRARRRRRRARKCSLWLIKSSVDVCLVVSYLLLRV